MKNILATALISLWLIGCNNTQQTEQPAAPAVETAPVTQPPAEFADPALAEIGKRFHATFSTGDIDGWMNDVADDALFIWSNGDTLSGKPAISAYWKDRWTKLGSIAFSQQVWLPIKVNQPQATEAPGNWLLGWYRFDAEYKGGVKVGQFAHDAIHVNEAGKVDRFLHYLDMAPIKEAIAASAKAK